MKKVGIITYHHIYNYGSVLQAYALQKAIEKLHDTSCEIIDYSSEKNKMSIWGIVRLRIRRVAVYIIEWKRVYRTIKYNKLLNAKKKRFDDFYAVDMIKSGKVYHSYQELENDPPQYDIYITGSDQTWSPKVGLKPAMFLRFAPKGSILVAYAPSVGVSSISDKEKIVFKRYTEGYSAISCREKVGKMILEEILEMSVSLVLDPTFLLTEKDWNNIAFSPQIKTPYILCYFIGHRSFYRVYAERLSEEVGYPLYYIPVSWVDLMKKNKFVSESGPKEFLGLIRDASFVLTDSFHGTVFSIIYRKDFYSFFKIKGGEDSADNSRIRDILERLSLLDRLKNEDSPIEHRTIDYDNVETHLQKEREISWSFLKNVLE